MAADKGSGRPAAKGREPLLTEFEPTTYDQWRAAAEAALKGAPFDKKLLTKTPEGITLQPIYPADALEGVPHLGGLPGIAPYARGARALGHVARPWEVCEELVEPLPEQAGETLRADADRGLTAVALRVDGAARAGLDPDTAEEDAVGRGGVSIASAGDVGQAIDGWDPGALALHLEPGGAGLAMSALLFASAKQRGLDLASLRGGGGFDPLGELASRGVLDRPLERAFDEAEALVAWSRDNAPHWRPLAASGRPFHDAGASAVEELAFALAAAVEYVRELGARGVPADDACRALAFRFSVGPAFFTEVAKLRAARLVWAQAATAFGASDDSRRMWLQARSSAWSTTAADPWVNMLRATTETFSAVIAGADSVVAGPFDEAVRLPDEFSRRVARNVQIVLADESNLGRVVDPSGGSRYVEKLTHEIASQAWELFREVERKGGMAAALAEGLPRERAAATAAWRADQLGKRRGALIGTNMFPNPSEKPLERREPDWTAVVEQRRAVTAKARAESAGPEAALAKLEGARGAALIDAAIEAASRGATLGQIHGAGRGSGAAVEVRPLAIHRACDMYERLRERADAIAETRGRRPQVFLANMGPIKQHKARADFTTGFFEVGFFEVLGNDGFETPEKAAEAAQESGADIAVVCSTDPTYPELVPRFTAGLEKGAQRPMVILAGYPKDQIDDHRKAGVDDFIHIKSKNYAMLADLLERIGARS
jgi:methylmalonyl-CoA mutase